MKSFQARNVRGFLDVTSLLIISSFVSLIVTRCSILDALQLPTDFPRFFVISL